MNRIALREDIPPLGQMKGFIKKTGFLGAVIALLNFALIFSMLVYALLPGQYSINVGDILQNPISAPRDVEDSVATEELRQEARDSVARIYRLDEDITEGVIQDVEDIYSAIGHTRELAEGKFEEYKKELEEKEKQKAREKEESQENQENQGGPETAETEIENPAEVKEPIFDDILTAPYIFELKEEIPIALSDDEFLASLKADEKELEELKEHTIETLKGILELQIKQDNLLEAKNAFREEMLSLPISNEVRLLGTSIGIAVLKPNMVYDEEATEAERDRVSEGVETVMYKKGQYIIQAGQPITERQYAMLQKLGVLKEEGANYPVIFGLGATLILLELVVIFYLYAFERATFKRPSHQLMMSLIIWMTMGLALVMGQINEYLAPTALGAMLLTILLGPGTAMIINTALAVLLGLVFQNHIGIMIMTIAGGIAGIFSTQRAQQRNRLIWGGILVGCVNFLSIIGYEMITFDGWLPLMMMGLWGLGSGLLSGIFLVGTLPIWENIFGIVTPIRLVELSNPNHPVLKRLLVEAPGTYHHSVIVANLAENAAEAIGADGLLARVGAYYHDIGKLKRPYYFKENQLTTGNPHDKLNPSLSTHIIISHTRDGVELAKKHKVPKVLQEFIVQHHGTGAVVYFYHKAKENDKVGRVNIEDFRYPGPKPKKRETAIVMMADTVEAAVRSMQDPTPGKVEGLIRKLIKGKLEDGQLDDCHLTLKDLNTIANAFTGVMTGVFHERIEYPELDMDKEAEGVSNKTEAAHKNEGI